MLIKLENRKNLKGALIWGGILSIILIIYLAFFPSMASSNFSELINSKLGFMPEGLLESFGLNEMPDFGVFLEYFCYVFQFVIIGLAIYAMILGTKSISKEEGDKSIEYLYSKPVKRSQIVTAKIVSSLMMILLVITMVLISSIICALFLNEVKSIKTILIVNIFNLIPILAYWMIGFVFSVILRDDSKSIVLALSFFFGTYLVGVISNTVDKLDFLKYFSPINYNTSVNIYKFFENISNHSLNILGIIICAIIIIGGTIYTYLYYNKKDLYC